MQTKKSGQRSENVFYLLILRTDETMGDVEPGEKRLGLAVVTVSIIC